MEIDKLKKYNNLTLLQICSTVFPTGGFNHSFGLETYINQNKVKTKQELLTILKTYLKTQFLFNDALGMRLLDKKLKEHDDKFILEIDELFHVATLPKETREGYKKVGVRTVECLIDIIPDCKELVAYMQAINDKKAHGNAAVAYTIAFNYLNIDIEEGIENYLYMNIQNLIQNAIRAIPLGPSDGIYVANEIKPFVKETVLASKQYDIEDFGINGFSIEIAQMDHEESLIRLFMS